MIKIAEQRRASIEISCAAFCIYTGTEKIIIGKNNRNVKLYEVSDFVLYMFSRVSDPIINCFQKNKAKGFEEHSFYEAGDFVQRRS